jgi:very-short-patch-repair endonuclease
MGRTTLQWSRVWALAERQHDVVARRQLLALGMSSEAIQHRITRRRLHVVFRGVYAVGRPDVTREGRWMAAVLSCGDDAALSHRSAAALYGICGECSGLIDVSVPANTYRERGGIRIHRRIELDTHVTERDRIPVTVPATTLIDLSTSLDAVELESAINAADRLDLIDPETLRAVIDASPGRPGVAVLRDILDRRSFRLTDSDLERRFLRLCGRAGLPAPVTQEWLNGYRVDCYWPEIGLVVETDGLRYHRTAAQQATDRARDQAHIAAGLVVLRFTHGQVYYDPEAVINTLRKVAARLRSSAGSSGP